MVFLAFRRRICTKYIVILVYSLNSDIREAYANALVGTIGYDDRFGSKIRLQQALMYYRPHPDDSQYTYPLDFCPIYDADAQTIIHVDVPKVRRPLNTAPPINYHADAIKAQGGFRKDLKPINITQPEVSRAGHKRSITALTVNDSVLMQLLTCTLRCFRACHFPSKIER